MKKHILGVALLGFSVLSFAQPSATHYQALDGKSGANLLNAISSAAANGYHNLGYDGLWTAYQTTDSRNGKIWDMYGNCDFSYSRRCGQYSDECDCYNREHSVPKSWWGGGTTNQGCDIFILVPTDGKVNGMRSNYPFGEVANATYTYAGAKLGSSAMSGYSGTVFEPVDEYKGDFARGIFGAMVRWKGSWTQGNGGSTFNGSYTSSSNYGLTAYGVALLMKWHRQDPVSQKELDRNNGIEQTQGNRNPFIDYPCLAEYLWGNKKDQTLHLADLMSSYDANFNESDGCACVQPTEPTLTQPTATSLSFAQTTINTSATQFITVKGVLLTKNITLSLSGANAAYFQVSPSTVTAAQALAGQQVAIIYTPALEGQHSATLTLSSTELTAHTLTLSGTGVESAPEPPAPTPTGDGDYVKVMSNTPDMSGRYLIVYEGGDVILNGALDATNLAKTNVLSVTISNQTIASTTEVEAASFVVASSGNGYTIQNNDGLYIDANSTKNTLVASETEAVNTISIASGDATITGSCGTRTLRYNTTSRMFRYYTSGQQPIQLYRKVATPTPPTALPNTEASAVVIAAQGRLQITADQAVEVSVYDALGRLVVAPVMTTSLEQTLPQGLYLVRINNATQRVML